MGSTLRVSVRRWLVGLSVAMPLLLAGCADDEAPPQTFAPLGYAYLRPLRLNVGSIAIVDQSAPGPGDLAALSPALPSEALRQMAQDRLVAAGAGGRATFTIQQASLIPAGDSLNGMLRVRLDITTSAGQPAAFAEAAVARSTSGPSDNDGMRAALYGLTRQMMSDMNVELEFQMRRTLGDWLQAGPGAAPPPAPVQQEDLAPPAASHAPGPPGFRLVPPPPPTRPGL